MNIPDVIVAKATVSYTKAELIRSLEFANIDVTDENILTLVDMWASEDFPDIDYFLTDEKGNALA